MSLQSEVCLYIKAVEWYTCLLLCFLLNNGALKDAQDMDPKFWKQPY